MTIKDKKFSKVVQRKFNKYKRCTKQSISPAFCSYIIENNPNPVSEFLSPCTNTHPTVHLNKLNHFQKSVFNQIPLPPSENLSPVHRILLFVSNRQVPQLPPNPGSKPKDWELVYPRPTHQLCCLHHEVLCLVKCTTQIR